MIRKFFTSIKDGFKGVFRNGLMSFASIFVLLSSLLMIGIFTTLIKNVNYNLEGMEDFKKLVCYMDLESDDETLENAKASIETFDNVAAVTVVTKHQALEQEKEKYSNDANSQIIFEMYENGRANPLPNALEIEYYSNNGLEQLISTIQEVEGVDTIRNTYEIAQNIENLKSIVTIGGTWLMVLLCAVAVFVIANTIKLTYHSRELEINIMRYIGATKRYITMPFVVESIIISVISAGIGYLAQLYIYTGLVEGIQDKYRIVKILPFEELNAWFLIIYFGVGLFMGVFGSVITIRKYMKV